MTGSNAHLLSSEIATHLTGRHIPIVLFPFTFPEFLRVQGGELTTQEKAEACRSYVECGGYPEPLIKGIPRKEYLTTLVRSILYKDIVVRHHIRAPGGLEDLATHLMANVANRYSLKTLTDVSRLRSVHTVEKYLRHLDEAFLVFSLRRFSFKTKEPIRSNRKAYCTDNGLITSATFRFSPGVGGLFENVVAVALHRRRMQGELECFYWQGDRQEEVDFVVKRGTRITQLIQVCVDAASAKTRSREIRGLLKASRELNCDDLVLLTASSETQERASWFGTERTIRSVPLWKWLLEA